jgi:threonine/homoserine/homoserine lactone efflux protein
MDATAAIKAFVFGATIAAAIGPIALLIINVSAADGLARGIRASLGAAVADLVFATTAFAGGYVVTSVLEEHRGELSALASVVLIVFGAWMAAQAWRPGGETGSSNSRWLRAPFLQTFVLTIVNPLGVIAFMSLAVQLPAVASVTAMAGLCLCVFAGSLLVQLALAFGGSLLARLTDHTGWLRALNLASGVGVAAFGVVGLLPLLQSA